LLAILSELVAHFVALLHPQTQTKNRKTKIMIKVNHSLNFVTEFDETHPIGKQALSLPHSDLVAMLEGMLKDLVVPALASTLEDINARGTYAILKVAE